MAQDRITREKEFFDELVVEGSSTRTLLDRFSVGFYDKGEQGRLWGPVWKSMDMDGATVLDYGCGKGDFSLSLASRGARVVGIDISPKLIEQARASASRIGMNGASPQFMVGDAHRTPFDDSTFDYVVGNGALHHLDLDTAYAEIARVLKPGGKALFMEPMYHHPLLWTLRRLTPKTHTADEKPLSFADMDKAKRWFRACSHREHFFLAVCFAPAHLCGKAVTLAVLGGVDRFDQVLMRLVPSIRKFAWLTMMEMEK
jgi:ubiquinone/menaquinone biosynthesis C-methylase UbiE